MEKYNVQTLREGVSDILQENHITCDLEYEGIADLLRTLTRLRQEVRDTFDPVIKQAHEAHRTSLRAKKKHEGELTEIMDLCKDRMIQYRDSIKEGQEESLSIAHTLPEVTGISYRTVYTASVDDRKAFVQHVLENWDEWNEVIQLKSGVLNRYARTMRNCGTTIPGLSIQDKKSVALRKGKE